MLETLSRKCEASIDYQSDDGDVMRVHQYWISKVRGSLVERPQSKYHSILLRGTVSLTIPRQRSSKSLFVATKTDHGGRLLRSLNASELPVERSNPLRTGWCQTQARVVCIVYCCYARSFGKDGATPPPSPLRVCFN